MNRALATLLLAGSAIGSANAYTPSSGFWYNPAESGTGIGIEIEDKTLFLAAYVYDMQGRPTWVLSSGNLTSTMHNGFEFFNTYNGQLDSYANGQFIGGPYQVPQYFPNASGPVQIVFDPTDETRAMLTWGGRSTPIQRVDYYAGFGAADKENQRMIGEWSVLVDMYQRGGQYAAYPFYGDVLVFDVINHAPTPDAFEGCRPTTSLDGSCTAAARNFHPAAGYFHAPSDQHIAVVIDSISVGGTPARYWMYYLNVNISDFEGVVELYSTGETTGDGPFYPVRGNRTASRSYVLDGGAGPNAVDVADDKSASVESSMAKQIMANNGGVMPAGLTADEVKARFGIDVKVHQAKLAELLTTMGQK